MKTYFYILFAFAATTAQADTRDYAYSWTIVPDVGGPAYQVEVTPQVYAALSTNDLSDFDVVNNKGESVPTALYRPAAATPRSPIVALPMFTIPAPPSETPAASDDAIHLHIERGPDGRLKSLDAATAAPLAPTGNGGATRPLVGASAQPLSAIRQSFEDHPRREPPARAVAQFVCRLESRHRCNGSLRDKRQRRPAKLAHARSRRRRDTPDAGRKHTRTPRNRARPRTACVPDADAHRQRSGAARFRRQSDRAAKRAAAAAAVDRRDVGWHRSIRFQRYNISLSPARAARGDRCQRAARRRQRSRARAIVLRTDARTEYALCGGIVRRVSSARRRDAAEQRSAAQSSCSARAGLARDIRRAGDERAGTDHRLHARSHRVPRARRPTLSPLSRQRESASCRRADRCRARAMARIERCRTGSRRSSFSANVRKPAAKAHWWRRSPCALRRGGRGCCGACSSPRRRSSVVSR